VQGKICAGQEAFVGRILLLFDWIEAVDEVAAGYRIRAKISALRRNLAEQALHLAPY
jgi:hypothetical protein